MTESCYCDDKPNRIKDCQNKLNNCPNYKTYPRIYLQFNDLPFEGMESVETADLSGEFKVSTEPYPFQHGSYYGGSFKNGELLMGEQDLSLDLMLPFVGLTRTQVLDYHTFIQYNLTRAGKLWAVDPGGKLIWANAIPKHPPYSDYEISDGKRLHLPMDFLLPDGVWHVADTKYVFLEPYDMCDFKDCMSVCTHDCTQKKEEECCSICACVPKEYNYCYTCWNPYQNCENCYRIIYDCKSAKKYFGDQILGEQFNQECKYLTGHFCSNSIYQSPVTLTLAGEYKNPTVTVNDVTISVKGCFNGELMFKPKGEITYTPYEDCDEKYKRTCRVKYEDINYEDAQTTFKAHYGNNVFYVSNDRDYCSDYSLAFISVDELTI